MRKGPKSETLKMRKKMSGRLGGKKIKGNIKNVANEDFEHMIKAKTHKEGVRIGKTPKKLASICCP
jgi:hypothetical protein